MGTEKFFSELSEQLRQKGFSTGISKDGCLVVIPESGPGSRRAICMVGKNGEVYCSSKDLKNPFRKKYLDAVLAEVNALHPEMGHPNTPKQNPIGGMTLG